MIPMTSRRVRFDAKPLTKSCCRLPAMLLVATLTGCVQVSAPDKPIEINLNINIRQEVVVRLQEDVRDLIEKNPGVF